MAEIGSWEAWPNQETTRLHIGHRVAVRNISSEKVLLTGRVVAYSDLLGSGGILQPHPEKGMDFVTAAFRFPQDPKEFGKHLGGYLFQVIQ